MGTFLFNRLAIKSAHRYVPVFILAAFFICTVIATGSAETSNSELGTLNLNSYFSGLIGTDKAFQVLNWADSTTGAQASITKNLNAGEVFDFFGGTGARFTLNDSGFAGDFQAGDGEYSFILPLNYLTGDNWTDESLYAPLNDQDEGVDTYANFFINGNPPSPISIDHFVGNNLLPAAVSIFNNNTSNPTLQWSPVTDASNYMVLVWNDTKTFMDSNGFFDISDRVHDFPIGPDNFDGVNYSVNLASLGGGDYQFAVAALGNGDEFKDGMSIAGNTVSVTPEPISSALFLLGSGVLGVNVLRKKKRIS